jgi:hypothetical protein
MFTAFFYPTGRFFFVFVAFDAFGDKKYKKHLDELDSL